MTTSTLLVLVGALGIGVAGFCAGYLAAGPPRSRWWATPGLAGGLVMWFVSTVFVLAMS